jgi:hypothetical protein
VESATDDRIVLRRKSAGASGILAIGIIYAIYQFITENWVYIVTIAGIVIVCTIRVVQKPQFLNNFRLKNSKMQSILQDLFDNQPGY